MLLAFCSRGSCRALPISCGLRRCFGFGYRAKWDTLGAVCLQPDAAVLGQNAVIALFIENDIAVFADLRSAHKDDLNHSRLRCGTEDALVFKVEHGRVLLRCAGNELEGITLLA